MVRAILGIFVTLEKDLGDVWHGIHDEFPFDGFSESDNEQGGVNKKDFSKKGQEGSVEWCFSASQIQPLAVFQISHEAIDSQRSPSAISRGEIWRKWVQKLLQRLFGDEKTILG